MADALTNFGYSTVATPPSPPTSGTSLVVAGGEGSRFPPVPFNATIWPVGQAPIATNSEIVRVTAISTDTFTIVRQAEGSASRSVGNGDQIAATLTAQFVGLGLVNANPSYDLKIPDGHTVVVSEDYEIPASVDVEIAATGRLEIL